MDCAMCQQKSQHIVNVLCGAPSLNKYIVKWELPPPESRVDPEEGRKPEEASRWISLSK